MCDESDRNGVIVIRDLHYRYPSGTEALRGITLRIATGERVALVGPNGAGKSTLLLHLNGVLRGEGEVEIDGLPVSETNLRKIRARVGLVFQDPDDQLFSPTVFDDVAFGPIYMGLPEAEVRLRVSEALSRVGATGYEPRAPYHLSEGEKKRVAIATVLAMSPSILALDEPTAQLDPRGRRELIGLLSSLSQTLIVSTHDLRMVRELTLRTVVLDQGVVCADGPTDRVLSDRKLLQDHGLE